MGLYRRIYADLPIEIDGYLEKVARQRACSKKSLIEIAIIKMFGPEVERANLDKKSKGVK
jgi:hypothetical protein